MTAPAALRVVEAGNHSLEVGVRALRASGGMQEAIDAQILAAIGAFLNEHSSSLDG